MNKEKLFTQREISVAVNNAFVAALKPSRLGEIPSTRLKHLRAVAQALVEPVLAMSSPDVDEKLMEPEELVATLLAAALYVQLSRVIGTDKVPMSRLVKEVYT